MNTISAHNRQAELVIRIAHAASRLPDAGDGLWFHNDIRNNFYYASYLFAYAVGSYPGDDLPLSREAAKARASSVLLAVLRLQDQDPASTTFGHWPLGLRPTPREAKPHVLPVELMGSLMVYFRERYYAEMEDALQGAFDTALQHVYRSGFYRVPMQHYHHHEAKYTASKLIFGSRYDDRELLEDGIRSLEATLAFVRRYGMVEYGALPWFWHWVQAFTCAWELIAEPSVKRTLAELLDVLWRERAQFYLQGTWVGAQSRGWPHDMPRDGNVLFDYVQFGGFQLPEAMPRTEYAGFLYYPAPEDALRLAVDRHQPVEVTKSVPRTAAAPEDKLHSYVYITSSYAAGGIWERVQEFDNEQHRWDVTLPLDSVGPEAGVNQAYFYHPADASSGEGAAPGDPRHQTRYAEVLFDRNVILAVYPIPDTEPGRVLGVLPKGTWQQDGQSLYVYVPGGSGVYFAVHLLQPFRVEEVSDRLNVISEGRPNAVVVEALDASEARAKGLADLAAFAANRSSRKPVFTADEELGIRYTGVLGRERVLQLAGDGTLHRTVDGQPIDFAVYRP